MSICQTPLHLHEGAPYDGLAAPESMRTKLGNLAVAALLHTIGLPHSRQSLVTRQGRLATIRLRYGAPVA